MRPLFLMLSLACRAPMTTTPPFQGDPVELAVAIADAGLGPKAMRELGLEVTSTEDPGQFERRHVASPVDGVVSMVLTVQRADMVGGKMLDVQVAPQTCVQLATLRERYPNLWQQDPIHLRPGDDYPDDVWRFEREGKKFILGMRSDHKCVERIVVRGEGGQ